MRMETFDLVLEHLNKAMEELSRAKLLLKNEKIRFSILDTLMDKTDEAIQRWKSRL